MCRCAVKGWPILRYFVGLTVCGMPRRVQVLEMCVIRRRCICTAVAEFVVVMDALIAASFSACKYVGYECVY